MSWQKKIFAGLCAVAVLQLLALGTLVLPHQLRSAPPVAVFDPEQSLTMFVIWSNGRLEDEAFAAALPGFEEAVQQEITRLAGEAGLVIVRKGAVLAAASPEPADVTKTVMAKVLNDAEP